MPNSVNEITWLEGLEFELKDETDEEIKERWENIKEAILKLREINRKANKAKELA
jgi:flagellar biosynthesis/type III secretory pathway chaperone